MGSERSGADGALGWLVPLSWGKEARLAALLTGPFSHHKRFLSLEGHWDGSQ